MQYERLLAAGCFFSASGRASLFTSLGFGGGFFQRLGNVLDCEAFAFLVLMSDSFLQSSFRLFMSEILIIIFQSEIKYDYLANITVPILVSDSVSECNEVL